MENQNVMKNKRPYSLLFIVFQLWGACVFGQLSLKGRVLNNDLVPLPQVQILDKDSIPLGKTDYEGFFDFVTKETDVLHFTYIGLEWTEITDFQNCDFIEIILLEDAIYHMTARKTDRLRKIRFDQIENEHLKAVQKGLFTKKAICYKREFLPYKPALDRISKYLRVLEKETKKQFKDLQIGDRVKIPLRDNTSYAVCANCTEEDYDNIIEAKITGKRRRFLTLELEILTMHPLDSVKYRGKTIRVGDSFRYPMRFSDVIIN